MNIKLAPSILAADFARLGEEVKTLESAGAHYIHFDVMDGCFVPNISFGVPVLKSIRHHTVLNFDVHLMICEPQKYIEVFAKAGADIITVHTEAVNDPLSCIRQIKSLGKKAGVAVNPGTVVDRLYPLAEEADMLLIMSVNPGFGGQQFILKSLEKAEGLASYIVNNKLGTDIEMDGGIGLNNLRDVLNAGVNVIVAGTSIIAKEPAETKERVRAFLSEINSN